MSRINEEIGKNLLCLLYHPSEPIFLPKNNFYFDIPSDYVDQTFRDHLQNIYASIQTRFDNVRRVEIRYDIASSLLPADFLTQLQELKKNQRFSHFIKRHRDLATLLITKLMTLDANNLLTVAAIVRDLTNAELFHYCLTVTLLHREDTKHLRVLNHAECFPEKFIPAQDLANIKQLVDVYRNTPGKTLPVQITLENTGTNVDPEFSLAYFREDIGLNLHHWHWHLVYPFAGDERIIRKDRRGELFYYMHHEIMARYNIERFCNKLNVAERLLDLNETLVDGYFPMLDTKSASAMWSSRSPNVKLRDVNRTTEMVQVDKDDLLRLKDRLYDAIHKKKIRRVDGTEIDINNDQGIDWLGNIVEACPLLSPDFNFYGDYHNFGHLMIAFTQDPLNNYNQPLGVMGSNATAMRDPLFYRWHALVDDIFNEHKIGLPRYTYQNLNFDNIEVASVKIITNSQKENIIETFMTTNDVDVASGLDFVRQGQSPGQSFVRVPHLDHEGFQYEIKVNNATGYTVNGMVRIFMGPAQGYRQTNLLLTDQRNLMIEMDKFVAQLIPGRNNIQRKSVDSSITVPREQTFNSLRQGYVPSATANVTNTFTPPPRPANMTENDAYCGCGWPQHMLVPRGTAEGFPMVLFVIITDFELDRVEFGTNAVTQNSPTDCKESVSFCGLRDRKYPDKRPMGFPFDRPVEGNIQSLEELAKLTGNMQIRQFNIFYRPNDLIIESKAPFGDDSVSRLDFDIPDSNRKQN